MNVPTTNNCGQKLSLACCVACGWTNTSRARCASTCSFACSWQPLLGIDAFKRQFNGEYNSYRITKSFCHYSFRRSHIPGAATNLCELLQYFEVLSSQNYISRCNKYYTFWAAATCKFSRIYARKYFFVDAYIMQI